MLDNSNGLDRKAFLKKIIKLFFLFASFIMSGLYLFFAYPVRNRIKKLVHIYVCDEYELPVQGVRQFYITYPLHGKSVKRKIYIVKTGVELFVLSPVCTHLGCLVSWYRPEHRFICPCHGGQYDIKGNVIAGPPLISLSRLPLKIENEKVMVGIKI